MVISVKFFPNGACISSYRQVDYMYEKIYLQCQVAACLCQPTSNQDITSIGRVLASLKWIVGVTHRVIHSFKVYHVDCQQMYIYMAVKYIIQSSNFY